MDFDPEIPMLPTLTEAVLMGPKVRRGLTIEKILNPFLFTGRWLGLYPCSKGMKKSIVWSIPTLFWILFALSNSSYTLYFTESDFRKRANHIYVIVSEVINLLQILASLLTTWKSADVWLDLTEKVTAVESELAKMGSPLLYSLRPLAWEVAFRICCLSSIVYLRVIMVQNHLTRALGLWRVVILSCSELMSSALMNCLKQCYQHLNKQLSSKTVHQILQLEEAVQDAFSTARSVFEVRLLFRISTSYINSVIEIYFFMSTWNSTERIHYKLFHLLFPIYNLYEVSMAVYSIRHCSEEAKSFRKHLHGLVLFDGSNRLANSRTIRAYLNMKKNISYSACGLFPLDPTLIHSMLASAVNYLAILYQLSNPQTA